MEFAIFGETDLAAVDWTNDPDYQRAKATEDAADHRQAQLHETADQLWQKAHPGGDVRRLPSPGHPCWAAREAWIAADAAWEDAKKAREQAEAQAKARVQHVGENAGRAKWDEAERDVLPKLIHWLREYEMLRAEVKQKTDVTLPEISMSVCLNADDLTIFCDNMRKGFGT